MSFSNMIQDAVEGALSGHNNNNNNPNRDSNRDNNSNNNEDNEFNPAARYAESHTNTSGTESDTSLFTSALSFLNENKHRLSSDDINEREMIHAHQSLYGEGGEGQGEQRHDANSVGAGAAMQALKMFTTSEEGEKSGMDKNAFIGMAMAQAKKMFEEKEARGEVNGDKQSAINTAAEMALKMYLKSGGGGMAGTGGPGGGLLQLASKFL